MRHIVPYIVPIDPPTLSKPTRAQHAATFSALHQFSSSNEPLASKLCGVSYSFCLQARCPSNATTHSPRTGSRTRAACVLTRSDTLDPDGGSHQTVSYTFHTLLPRIFKDSYNNKRSLLFNFGRMDEN